MLAQIREQLSILGEAFIEPGALGVVELPTGLGYRWVGLNGLSPCWVGLAHDIKRTQPSIRS